MTDNGNKLQIDGLREDVAAALKTSGQKLIEELKDNLESISVVGSAITDDFMPGKSDINIVLVVGKRDLDLLKRLAGIGGHLKKSGISTPLIMTTEYIQRSTDVFSIEFLDFQLTHKTIFGQDPFAKLQFKKHDVRLQCERELKATLVRLRQSYIASGGKTAIMRDVLISTIGGLVPLLRAMLWLSGTGRPIQANEVLTKAAGQFSVSPEILLEVLSWRHRKVLPDKNHMDAAFEMVYAITDKLSIIVDELEVS